MTTTQSLILDRITAAIERDPSVVLLHDRQYANTGTLRTLDAETLVQIAAVTYDFQSGYCNFGPMRQRVASHWYGASRSPGQAAWVCDTIPALIERVTTHLTRKDPS